MSLDEWLEREGYGAAYRLTFAACVSAPTVQRAREGRCSLASALKISAATEYAVDVASMTSDEVPDGVAVPKKRVRGRT